MRSLGTKRGPLPVVLVLSLLLPVAPLAAQPVGTIRGIVVDAEGRPVKGATVKSAADKATATTDAAGLFTLKVKPGVHDVTASQKGFTPDTAKGVAVKAGAIKDISLLLAPGR